MEGNTRIMMDKRTSTERLTAFSDGVFSVIITIMVLDLKPPAQSNLSALLPLWPAALSYAVSCLFVAIIWINHHRLLLFAHDATPKLVWCVVEFRTPVHDITHTLFNCLDF
jgi:uncharacterized membrane protein